ncbi:MAG: hydroxypyruvate isomerase [Gemmatimonadetes bacterium]|nr:hydroxypyruvate isomerase [Gemmatimonadota bacterium]
MSLLTGAGAKGHFNAGWMMTNMNRRQAVGALGAFAVAGLVPGSSEQAPWSAQIGRSAGRLRHSVSRWCYGKIAIDDLCEAAKGIGYRGIDLLSEPDWLVPRKHGLDCAMANGFGSIPVGFNRPDNHDKLVADAERMIPLATAAQIPNIVCFSGNRAGMSDGEGVTNCVTGLKRLMPLAEQHGVTLCLELLNSKVDHKDYQCDHTAWGAQVVQGVNSPRLKLLFDIYHMQIMEGDIIRTIRTNFQHIGHFHTGGVPGRAEIDDSQELNYRSVMQAIADLGYKGFVAQEFVPRRDPLTSLRQAFEICDV